MAYTHQTRNPNDVLLSAEWNAMGEEVERLGLDTVDRREWQAADDDLRRQLAAKLERGGDTVGGPLAVQGELTVGTPFAGQALRVFRRQENGIDTTHGALILGNDAPTSASLRMGYAAAYSWIQGQGQTSLALNPRGGNVGVNTGTVTPKSALSVAGGLAVGSTYAPYYAAAAGVAIIESRVGIGTTSPRSALDTGQGVMTGAANDYAKAQYTLSGGGQVTWGGPGGRLRWTGRFIATALPARTTFASGQIVVAQPTADIPATAVHNGVARSATADGVQLNAWEALYAVHTPGGDHTVTFQIVSGTRDFLAPSNWILIAFVNGDDGTVKLGTGQTVGRGGLIPRLDTAEHMDVVLRAADLKLGHSTRRGTPGRALVDQGSTLVLNWMKDWASGVSAHGDLSVEGSVSLGGDLRWGAGSVLSTDQGGSIELGGSAPAGAKPYIDFHFGGLPQDNNVRLQNDADGHLSVFGKKMTVHGKLRSGNTRVMAGNYGRVDTVSRTFVDIPDLQATVDVDDGPVLILVKIGGVQVTGATQASGEFRLMIGGNGMSGTRREFHNGGWELSDVSLQWMGVLGRGRHDIRVQWALTYPPAGSPGLLSLGWYGDNRSLIVVEL